MSYVIELFGAIGIIETIVEFSYALINLGYFTPFERAFFVTSGIFEIMGEIYVLQVMARAVSAQDSAPDACHLIKQYVRDPIHIYATSPWQGEDGYDGELETGVGLAIGLALGPTLFWWLVLTIIVFDMGFKSKGDEHVMLALAVISLCSFVFLSGILGRLYVDGPNLPTRLAERYVVLPCLYSVQKMFEVYLLLSRKDRLASGALGGSLVTCQVGELLLCAYTICKYALVCYIKCKKAREVKSQDVAPVQAPSSPVQHP